MKKIINGITFIVSFILIISIGINSFAEPVKITKEMLEESLNEISDLEKESNIRIDDKNIIIKENNKEYKIKYLLEDKPTFIYEIEVNKGIDYKKFKEDTDFMVIPLIGYNAISNIKGIDINDANTYFILTALKQGFNKNNANTNTNNQYIIIEDVNPDVKVEVTDTNKKVIYASEFGDKAIEYTDSLYKDKSILKDDFEDGINSFELITENIKTSETSRKLKNTLIINTEADYSKLKGISDNIKQENNDLFLDKNITKENADIVVGLKEGQKCEIISKNEFKGYEKNGSSIDIKEKSKNAMEIVASKLGKSNGYIHIGNEKKSFYITVEKNEENAKLKTIRIDLDEKKKEDSKKDETPKTGENYSVEKICIVLMLSAVIIIAFVMLRNKKEK